METDRIEAVQEITRIEIDDLALKKDHTLDEIRNFLVKFLK